MLYIFNIGDVNCPIWYFSFVSSTAAFKLSYRDKVFDTMIVVELIHAFEMQFQRKWRIKKNVA